MSGISYDVYDSAKITSAVAAEEPADHVGYLVMVKASENPKLPEALAATESEIIFIDPPAAPMRALGDRIGSTKTAQSAGVPCISWNGNYVNVSENHVLFRLLLFANHI